MSSGFLLVIRWPFPGLPHVKFDNNRDFFVGREIYYGGGIVALPTKTAG